MERIRVAKHLPSLSVLVGLSLLAACASDSGKAGGTGGANTGGAASTVDAGPLDGGNVSDGSDTSSVMACDDGLKSVDLGSNTIVTLVRGFKVGDAISLATTPPASTPSTTKDLCLVKVTVGPGSAGPVGAPSTSAGIGIEVWLPTSADWNQRYLALGGSGWQGGANFTSPMAIGQGPGQTFDATVPAMEGFVTSATDTGHSVSGAPFGTGAFAMNPDGSFNEALFKDYAERSAHEMALKTKALAKAYYGQAPKYSYFNGCSKGGQQGLMEAQRYPDDFDGVLAGAPAINWDRFLVAELWPQIVMQQDLGGPIANAQMQAAIAAANASCGSALTGTADGYINDPSACQYDPSKDLSILCVSDGGNNSSASCLTFAQANVINKIWYGPTLDGTAPSPAADSGWNVGAALASNQLWYGLPRGTSGYVLAGGSPFSVITDQVALSLLDPSYATSDFVNATGNGRNQWKAIGYSGSLSFSNVLTQTQQRFHDLIGTDDPNLSAFSGRGGKLLMWHGTADELIVPQGSVNYYERVASGAGGYEAAQAFARFYLAPGIDHCGGASVPGTNPPIPVGDATPNIALFAVLQDWVENGKAPDQIAASSAPGITPVRTRPWCLYPKKLKYLAGDVNTGNFSCE